MHPKNALVAAPISLARSMREQREIAWAMSTIRCKLFCQSVKGGVFNIGQLPVRPIIHLVTSYGRINLHSRGGGVITVQK